MNNPSPSPLNSSVPLPLGLGFLPEFIDLAAEVNLLQKIDGAPWSSALRRRTQHYGYRYDYTKRTVDRSDWLGPLPEWAESLAHRLRTDVPMALPDQLIVNEYQPGQGIQAHVDCEPCFGETIVSLSLGADYEMSFERIVDGSMTSLYLARRSVLVLSGEARYGWKHGIAARKSDVVAGTRVKRGRRVSLTFRTVIVSDE